MTFTRRARYWLPLLPLLGLLMATYWLNQQVLPDAAKPDSSKRHDPDAIVENFSVTRLNELGVPNFVMAATKMQHYPDDDSTTLEAPRLTLLSPGQPAMHATAKQGTLSSKGEEIFLHDNVEVLREANARQDQLILHTDYLHIIPDQDLADTDRAVTIIDARNNVRGIGMEMNNRTRILKLLSQVKSEYVPNQR